MWCASPEETTFGRERGGGWGSPYYIRVAKNAPSFPLGHLSLIKANSLVEDHLLRYLQRGAACSFEFFYTIHIEA
jgi:hypothetical protein